MQKVLGFGGFFFRSADPDGLAKWYQTHLGVTGVPSDYNMAAWQQQAGTTVFAPFKQDTSYFPAEKQWMLNFRVGDLDAMIVQLRQAGIEVTPDPETYPNGKFARLNDPEGNAIELWEEQENPA